jgi:hypothetical protein
VKMSVCTVAAGAISREEVYFCTPPDVPAA